LTVTAKLSDHQSSQLGLPIATL